MGQLSADSPVAFGDPATYRIEVQGRLDARAAANMGDVGIDKVDAHSTTLEVKVVDQADLSGVLHSLYGLHLTILSVELRSPHGPIDYRR